MAVMVTILTSESDSGSAAVAAALKGAILAETAKTDGDAVITVTSVQSSQPSFQAAADHILCPLTLEIPDSVSFAQQALYHSCRDVPSLRQQVSDQGYATGEGELWLPVVLTARGPLYGEAIARAADGTYQQPLHLSDAQRQPLYRLGRWVLRHLAAPPGVYLLQGACRSDLDVEPRAVFDRLWPFPTAPALASLGRQSPDLLVCHWRCLTQQPIRDLQIQLRA